MAIGYGRWARCSQRASVVAGNSGRQRTVDSGQGRSRRQVALKSFTREACARISQGAQRLSVPRQSMFKFIFDVARRPSAHPGTCSSTRSLGSLALEVAVLTRRRHSRSRRSGKMTNIRTHRRTAGSRRQPASLRPCVPAELAAPTAACASTSLRLWYTLVATPTPATLVDDPRTCHSTPTDAVQWGW